MIERRKYGRRKYIIEIDRNTVRHTDGHSPATNTTIVRV